MKCFTVVSLALLASADAYTMPTLATRAVGRKKIGAAAGKASATKTVAPKKKVFAKKVATKPVKEAPKKKVFAKKVATKPVKEAPKKKVFAKKVATKPVKAAPKKKVFVKKVATKPVKAAPKKKFVPKKVAPKKNTPTKKAFVKPSGSAGPPSSKGYPSIASAASKIQFNIASKGSPPPSGYQQPNFADPRLQFDRDPAKWAAAARTRQSPLAGNVDYVFDDGLSVIERKQKNGQLGAFLSGSAKSQIDTTAIRGDLEADKLLFGLDADRFQLLFIAVFGLLALVGSLSGTVSF